MSYESPIKLTNTMESIVRRVREEGDKKIYECIANYGIDVNKEELEKTLRYDRNQYEKGYEDGKAEAMRWIPIKFRETTDEDGFDKEEHPIMLECMLPDCCEEVLVTTKAGHVSTDTFYDDDGAYFEDYEWDEIIAWMPLPEPYKEGE